MRRRGSILAATALIVLGLGPMTVTARAHGGDEMAIEDLAQQPAKILAQQALAELRIQGDSEDAAARLDAAVDAKDQDDVDSALVGKAMELVDSGQPERAVSVLDEALSRPLGSAHGAALHEAGREFQPATDTQEVVAIIAGVVLLGLGALALRPRRRRAMY